MAGFGMDFSKYRGIWRSVPDSWVLPKRFLRHFLQVIRKISSSRDSQQVRLGSYFIKAGNNHAKAHTRCISSFIAPPSFRRDRKPRFIRLSCNPTPCCGLSLFDLMIINFVPLEPTLKHRRYSKLSSMRYVVRLT